MLLGLHAGSQCGLICARTGSQDYGDSEGGTANGEGLGGLPGGGGIGAGHGRVKRNSLATK